MFDLYNKLRNYRNKFLKSGNVPDDIEGGILQMTSFQKGDFPFRYLG